MTAMAYDFISKFDVEFDFKDPVDWFEVLEACFEEAGITKDRVKAFCLFKSLPDELRENIVSYVAGEEELFAHTYDEFKAAVLSFLRVL